MTLTASELINLASSKLKFCKISSHQIDSEILLSKALGKSREKMIVEYNNRVNSKEILKFKKFINRRSLKEPVAYILKEKEFWSKIFEVDRNTLIPRPETELMVDKLIKIYLKKKIFILDIGTGSGCILISLLSELNNSKGLGIDISKKALLIAEKNAKKHKIINNISFLKRSFSDIHNYKFDLIVSNPPYIKSKEIKYLDEDVKKYEPKIALDGGNDGLDVIKKVIYKSKEILKINGRLALEIGNGQSLKVSEFLYKNNFKIELNIKDYKENTRSIISKLIK